jgi:hypothetical protein
VKRKFFAAFLSLCMVMSLVPMTVLAAENDGAGTPSTQLPDPVDGVITLETDTTLQSTTFINENTVLDLNGKTLTLNGEIGIVVNNNTNFTVCDSSVTQPPQVTDEYDVNYSSGKIQYNNSNCAIQVQNGANFTLESGTIYSDKGNGVNVLAQTKPNEEEYNSSATIKGGYISAQEFGIGVYGRTAVLNVNGGVIEARDNAAVAGNGSRDADYTPEGYVINVNEGTLIGKITSDGYASCGIYHPNAGTVNVIGGEIISTKGAGIVARAGQTNISGGRITALGESNFAGKVGDSRVVVSTSGVVLDLAANYGGADIENGVATNADVYVSGEATISGTNSSIDVIEEQGSSGSGVKEQDNVIITGGTFKITNSNGSSSDSINTAYFPEGAILTQDKDGNVVPGTPGEGESAVAEVNGVSYTSLQNAINTTVAGNKVTLLKDTTENVTIEEGQDLVLDLNGYTLNGGTIAGEAALTNYGTVTIQDSSAGQTGRIQREENGQTSAYYVLDNHSKMTIAGGTIYNNSGDNVNGASLIRNIGTQESAATLEITGGNLQQDNFIVVKNDDYGKLTVTGGTKNNQAIQNWNDAEIKGGLMDGQVITWSYTEVPNNAKMEITGGKIDGPVMAINYYSNNNYGTAPNVIISETACITGELGTYTYNNGVTTAIKDLDQAKIEVNGGTFGHSVNDLYLSDNLSAELYSLSNDETPYSYYPSVEAAQAAAQPGDVVTDLTTVEENANEFIVVFDYGDGTKKELTMYEGAETTLPTLNDRGYNHFVGWTDGEKTYAAGDEVKITANTTFTAQWAYIPPANPNYKITIGDMENGTVTANPSAAKAGATVTLTATPDEGYAVGSITVTDRFGDAVKVTENADGTYTFTMPNGQVTVTATFVETEAPVDEPFVDVAEGDWFYDAVVYAYQNELMDGVGGNRFAPNSETTRAQLVTILHRLAGQPAPSGDSGFSDVETGTWYTDAVAWAAQNGIVNGVSDTQFAPGDDITREQLAVILYRYATYQGYDVSQRADLSGFVDAGTISTYVQEALSWANAQGLVLGFEDDSLRPQGNASRAQIAAVLMRFCQTVAE